MAFWTTLVGGILLGGVYGLVATSLNLVFGVMGVVNFAHGEVLMLALYLAFGITTKFGIHPILSSLIVMIPISLLAFPVFKAIFAPFQAGSMQQVLSSMGLSIVLANLALFFFGGETRSVDYQYTTGSIPFFGIDIVPVKLYAFAGAVVVALGLAYWLKRTDQGLRLRAVSSNPRAAQLYGIKPVSVYHLSFVASFLLLGVSSGLLLCLYYVSPNVGQMFTLTAFMAIVLGGLGSIEGAFLGAVIISVIETVGALWLPGQVPEALTFLVFVLFLALRPQGLLGGRNT